MKLNEVKPLPKRKKTPAKVEVSLPLLEKPRKRLVMPKPTGLPKKAEGPWIEFFEV